MTDLLERLIMVGAVLIFITLCLGVLLPIAVLIWTQILHGACQ